MMLTFALAPRCGKMSIKLRSRRPSCSVFEFENERRMTVKALLTKSTKPLKRKKAGNQSLADVRTHDLADAAETRRSSSAKEVSLVEASWIASFADDELGAGEAASAAIASLDKPERDEEERIIRDGDAAFLPPVIVVVDVAAAAAAVAASGSVIAAIISLDMGANLGPRGGLLRSSCVVFCFLGLVAVEVACLQSSAGFCPA
mmetsp:Transcript_18477/g.59020  ORF Transcript_18477/g.59020 Transcript_18477/m.59020 type:complete len:203 (+) Transcript_18477:1139-1747(+)